MFKTILISYSTTYQFRLKEGLLDDSLNPNLPWSFVRKFVFQCHWSQMQKLDGSVAEIRLRMQNFKAIVESFHVTWIFKCNLKFHKLVIVKCLRTIVDVYIEELLNIFREIVWKRSLNVFLWSNLKGMHCASQAR